MWMVKNPCKDCVDRSAYCHCDCEKYEEYKNQLQQQKKKEKEQNMISKTCYSLVDNRFRSLKKKQVRRGDYQ